jgi:hypothetical protein
MDEEAQPFHPRTETIIMDQEQRQLAFLDVPIWPTRGAVIELGEPNRDTVVQGVRLRLSASHASTLVDVLDLEDQVVERVVSG